MAEFLLREVLRILINPDLGLQVAGIPLAADPH
jgi:hypothetical protein